MSTPQLGLFDSPAQRSRRAARPHRIQKTSLEAHDGVVAGSAALRARVLRFIVDRGRDGATDEELSRSIPMQLQTVNPRRGELVRDGYVVNSGRRRATQAGRSAIVWIAKVWA